MRVIIIIGLVLAFFMLEGFMIPNNYQTYIDKHLIKAKHLEATYGLPVSIQFAQAIYESGAGRSNIAQQSCNHFGIRCGDDWHGLRYYSASGCWREYENVSSSWADHACFLQDYYPHVCFKGWEAWTTLEGYGESGYWGKITKIVKRYKLYELDKDFTCK
jgi:flagellum-specific peptidoglycan hydrolase FlgJ